MQFTTTVEEGSGTAIEYYVTNSVDLVHAKNCLSYLSSSTLIVV